MTFTTSQEISFTSFAPYQQQQVLPGMCDSRTIIQRKKKVWFAPLLIWEIVKVKVASYKKI